MLCLIIAAGWTEGEAGQQGERVGINAETVLNHDPLTAAAPEIETARLAKFWTVDRFLLDEGGPVFVDKDYAWSLLAKAKPDECFNGIGEAIGNPAPDGTCASGIPKVNDAYVWGLTKAGSNLFFGTLANTHCLVEAAFLGVETGHQTSEWVCEFGASRSGTGDFRAPNFFRYDLVANGLVSLNPTLFSPADILRRRTIGIRSAGNLDGVVFMAGPASGSGGINLFAFDADSGALLGTPQAIGTAACASPTPPEPRYCPGTSIYTNVRMWAAAKGALYVGLGTSTGGAVLRWVGNHDDPYQFVEVGHLPSDAANMILHDDDRLYITTWPHAGNPAGLYRSPVIPLGGLVEGDVNHPDWTTPLWLATSDGRPEHAKVPTYDPDRVTGYTTGGGALVSYKGRIYFGTMSVPFVAAQAAAETYALPTPELLRTALGTHRSIAIFEVKFPTGKPKVSMIIGEKFLPVYDAATNGYTIRYDKAHQTGFAPRWGASGLGNFFNTYTWAMAVFDDQVFVGTFDWSQLARVELETVLLGSDLVGPAAKEALLRALGDGFPREGGDLIRFSDDRIFAESVAGLGNDRNYGFRNFVTDGSTLWVGTANPMNLDPLGGWELIELK